jgi:hypothetical protein
MCHCVMGLTICPAYVAWGTYTPRPFAILVTRFMSAGVTSRGVIRDVCTGRQLARSCLNNNDGLAAWVLLRKMARAVMATDRSLEDMR